MGTIVKEIHLYGTGTLRRALVKCEQPNCNDWLWHLEGRGLTGCPSCGFVKADDYEISEEEYNTVKWYFKELYPMLDKIDRDTQRHARRKAFGM